MLAAASSTIEKRGIRLGAWFLLVAVCWTILIAALAGWACYESYSLQMKIAHSAANNAFDADLHYRQWISYHGGMYVPVDAETQPNPYLAFLPDRDVTTLSGKKLTLLNPAYMNRKVEELHGISLEVKSRITSRKFLRPENAPDVWEENALRAFERGEKEASSLETLGNERYLRFMRPMFADQGCLKCHAIQGHRVGDLCGGMSVSMPWAPYQEAFNAAVFTSLASYGGIWLVGILGLLVFHTRLKTYVANLERTKNALRDRESLHQTLLTNLPVGFMIIDPQTRIVESVSSYAALMLDAPEEEIVGHRCHEFLCRAEEHACPICDLGMEVDNSEKVMLRADGSSIPILKSVKMFRLNGEEKLLETFVDLTAQKKADEAIRESDARYRLLFDKSPDACFTLDNGVFTDCNETALAMLGVAREEVIGKSPIAFSPKPQPKGNLSADLADKWLHGAMETEAARFEWLHRCPDGRDLWLDISLALMPAKGRSIILANCRDITQRKAMEETLRVKTAFLSGLLMSIPDIIFFKDERGVFLGCNPEFARLVNREMPSVVGLTDYDLFDRDSADFFRRRDAIAMAEGKACRNEEWVEYPNGRHVLLETHKAPLKDIDGRIIGLLGVSRNITDRKLAEEALLESENKYRGLFEYSHDAILIIEPPSWRFASANPAALKIFKVERLEQLADLGMQGVSTERQPNGRLSAELTREIIENTLREGFHEFEWTHKRSDGEEFPAVVMLTKMEQEGKLVIQATVRDVTAQKKAEDELRASESRLRSITNSAQDVIFTLDKSGNFRYISPAWQQHFGSNVDDVLGKPFMPFVYPDDVPPLNEYMNRVLSGTQNEPSPPYRVKHADGGWRWFEANGTRFVDAKGEVQYIGVGRDITDRKLAEDQLWSYASALEAANRQLEELNRSVEMATRAKSEFLANMSHEIRTPMTAILGFADLLLNEEGIEMAPPRRRHRLETIKRNGVHLLELINDILDLSKVEAGKLQIDPVHCSPFELMSEVVSLMKVRADAKQLKLSSESAGLLPEMVSIDPLRTRQVLVNLVGNAIKFTDQGEIRIVAKLIHENDRPRLRFDVIDTGIGMNEEQIGKLFQAFTQVDNSATRKFGGTGLGLRICKRLSEAMGGSIEVHSAPGKGSVFSFTVDPGPIQGMRMIHHSNRPERQPAMPPEATGKIELPYSILVAEDGPDNQRLIRAILEDAGAKVTTVENGRLAVEATLAARQTGTPFRAILMDMQMPILDGYAATQELRAQRFTAPIIALTAHAMSDDRQRCLDAGCDDYLSKPIDWQHLLATIRRWVNQAPCEMPPVREEAIPGFENDNLLK